jgi:protein-disulfide isomerase
MLNRRFTLTIAALAAGAFTFAATPAGALSDKDRPEIEAIIKDYLIKNPEVIGEAIEALQKKQDAQAAAAQAPAIAANKKVIFESPRGPSFGNPEGDVTLVEFFDYNCGYCKQSLKEILDLVKADPKLKVVLKEFPILHQDSVAAAKVAVAVRMQDKGGNYLSFHTKLMGERHANEQTALAAAKATGFDMARIQKDKESDEVKNTLRESFEIAKALQLQQATPTFILGGSVLPGALPAAELKKSIASVRKCGLATC